MKAIWLVEGSTGEYSDHREWPVGWYETQDEAEDAVTALTRAVNTLGGGSSDYKLLRKVEEKMRDLSIDAGCSIDYTGINYRAYEVAYGPSGGDIANKLKAVPSNTVDEERGDQA